MVVWAESGRRRVDHAWAGGHVADFVYPEPVAYSAQCPWGLWRHRSGRYRHCDLYDGHVERLGLCRCRHVSQYCGRGGRGQDGYRRGDTVGAALGLCAGVSTGTAQGTYTWWVGPSRTAAPSVGRACGVYQWVFWSVARGPYALFAAGPCPWRLPGARTQRRCLGAALEGR